LYSAAEPGITLFQSHTPLLDGTMYGEEEARRYGEEGSFQP
jgi:hypothetical protein